MKALGLAALLVVVPMAQGVARADEIRVPGDARNLRAALERARPGDTIQLRRKTVRGYHEVVTDGVTITGREKGTRLLGKKNRRDESGVAGVLTVRADGVTVRGLQFRKGGLHAQGDDLTVENCSFVDQVPFRNRATALEVKGDGATVKNVEMDLRHGGETFVSGIQIEGNGAVISGGSIEADRQSSLYDVTGDDAIVEDNDFRKDPGLNIGRVTGDRSVVRGNDYTGGAMQTFGSDGLVEGNMVTDTEFSRPALQVIGNDNVISGNVVFDTEDSAVVIYGDRNTVRVNSVSDVGIMDRGNRFGNGYVIRGSGNRAEDNTATNVIGEGFRVAGNTDGERHGTGVFLPGMTAAPFGPGNEIVRCRATDAGRCGLGNWTVGTCVTDSTFTGNTVDVVNGGEVDIFTGNDWRTGGPDFVGSGDGALAPDFGGGQFDVGQLTGD